MRIGRHAKDESKAVLQDGTEVDLSKLKKRELLEIMLRQGEEIDKLRAQVTELESKLEDRQFAINRAGSIVLSFVLSFVFAFPKGGFISSKLDKPSIICDILF